MPTCGYQASPKAGSEELILVMGLSESVCLPLEVWSHGQGAAIVGILPLPVAVLAWCNAVLPTDKKHSIVLVAGETGVVVGIIKERKLTNLLKVQTIEDALANVRRNADEFALEDPAMYLWYSKPPTMSDDELTQEGLTIIDQEHLRATLGAPLLLMQSTGKRTISRRSDPAPAELVSETIERINPCNRFSFPKRSWRGRPIATIAGTGWRHSY